MDKQTNIFSGCQQSIYPLLKFYHVYFNSRYYQLCLNLRFCWDVVKLWRTLRQLILPAPKGQCLTETALHPSDIGSGEIKIRRNHLRCKANTILHSPTRKKSFILLQLLGLQIVLSRIKLDVVLTCEMFDFELSSVKHKSILKV